MNIDSYVGLLDHKLREIDSVEESNIRKRPEFKALESEISKLEKDLRTLREKREKIVDKLPPRYETRREKIEKFKNEYRELVLIFDKKKRTEAKVKLLKKYDLWR